LIKNFNSYSYSATPIFVIASRCLATEIKEIDIYYTLDPEKVVDEQKRQTLGLLGRFAITAEV
jgi:hypothetical protein